jgi:hypothetical protein
MGISEIWGFPLKFGWVFLRENSSLNIDYLWVAIFMETQKYDWRNIHSLTSDLRVGYQGLDP